MDRQREAATGGEVIFVCFVARTASREPFDREQPGWLALARQCEEAALTARTKAERAGLIRCALAYRAKAGAND